MSKSNSTMGDWQDINTDSGEFLEDDFTEDEYISEEEGSDAGFFENDEFVPEEEISYDVYGDTNGEFSEEEMGEIEYEDVDLYNVDYRGDEEYESDDEDDDSAVGGMGNIMDKIIAFTGVAVLILALVTVGFFLVNKNARQEAADFAGVGSQIDTIQMIGEQGIAAVTDALLERIASEENFEYEDDGFGDYDENEYERDVTVVLNMTSIQKDLKIKFVSKKSGKLVPNVPFAVSVKAPDGKTSIWSDDDMDGIIYKKNITPGNYEVEMDALTDSKYDKYTLTTGRQSVVVKKDISYQKVDVENEVKKESEIDAKKEDTAKNETVVESELKDTVAWVDSKVITSTYVEVPKSTITDPITIQVVKKAFMRMTLNPTCTISGEKTVEAGKTLQLRAIAATGDDTIVVENWTYKWTSSDTGKATVEESTGKVTGVAAGKIGRAHV